MIKIDLYTKIVLTVIAVSLAVIAMRPILAPENVSAAGSIVQVDIAQVGGQYISPSPYPPALPVRLK
jgi:hypothetical protein